jgi:hypothetical protein
MGLSNAERQRRYRQRLKERASRNDVPTLLSILERARQDEGTELGPAEEEVKAVAAAIRRHLGIVVDQDGRDDLDEGDWQRELLDWLAALRNGKL